MHVCGCECKGEVVVLTLSTDPKGATTIAQQFWVQWYKSNRAYRTKVLSQLILDDIVQYMPVN